MKPSMFVLGHDMHLKKLTEDDIFVVTFKSHEALNPNSLLRIEQELRDFTIERKDVILDFHNIEFIDSGTIRALVSLQKRVSENKGTLKLANLHPSVQNIFEVTRLRHILDIYPSLEDAIGSLRSSSRERDAETSHVTVVTKNLSQNALLVRIEGTQSLDDSNVDSIKAKISQIIGNRRHVIINLENIFFMDSSGVKALAFCLRKMRKHGGSLKLSSLQPPVITLLKTTGWDKVIDIYENDERAISSLTTSDRGEKLKAKPCRLTRYHDMEFLME